jgi:hypothetical protein
VVFWVETWLNRVDGYQHFGVIPSLRHQLVKYIQKSMFLWYVGSTYKATRCYNPEDYDMKNYNHEMLKTYRGKVNNSDRACSASCKHRLNEEFCLLGVWYVESQPTFRRNISPPSSGSKNKPSKNDIGSFGWLFYQYMKIGVSLREQ